MMSVHWWGIKLHFIYSVRVCVCVRVCACARVCVQDGPRLGYITDFKGR